MYYMNKTKRNLILAAAIINLIAVIASFIMAILSIVFKEKMQEVSQYLIFFSYSTSLVYNIISLVAGMIGSILLLFSIREKGKYFRSSQGLYIAGFIIVVICGGFVPWILLFISLFISDIIVMNRPDEIKKEEILEERVYVEKKKRIEDLKRMRDGGLITEEEYKQKLFELL